MNTNMKRHIPIFLNELDGNDFLTYNQYKRSFPPIETKHKQSTTKKDTQPNMEHASLTRFSSGRSSIKDANKANIVDKSINTHIDRANKNRQTAVERSSRIAAELLKCFDACTFEGPRDWIYRRTYKDAVREVFKEFLLDRWAFWISDDGYVNVRLVDHGYRLFGRIQFSDPILLSFDIRLLVIAALDWKSKMTLRLMRLLAEQNDSDALTKLAEITLPMVKLINEKASLDAKILGNWPASMPYWPVLKSPHHDYDCDHKLLLKSLQIGRDFPFTITEEARWTSRDAVGKWAIHLCQEIETMQEGYYVEEDSEPWEKKLLELRPFSCETWKDWREVAKGLLQQEYIDVINIPELNASIVSSSDRRSAGVIRKRILQALKDKFKSMASENKS
jgi:hypothetical protein